MRELSGRVAFITGGASGIGLGIARAFASAGIKVAVADIRMEAAHAAAEQLCVEGGTAVAVAVDVACLDSWGNAADQAEARLGPVTILCNNAGTSGAQAVLQVDPLDRLPAEEWKFLLDVNLTGMFYGIRTFVSRFKQRGGFAHVVNTVSMAGLFPQYAGLPGAYVASKFGAAGLTEQLRLELMDFPEIGVSMLAPGITATNIRKSALEIAPFGKDVLPEGHVDEWAPVMAQAMDPENIGKRVLNGLRNNEFYIFTHPEYREMCDHYHARVAQGWGESAQSEYADQLPPPV